MRTAFIIRNRNNEPYFVAFTTDKGTTFRAISSDAKELLDAFKDEYKDSKITKQELSVALDRGMTVDGPMPETLVAQALKRKPKPKEKSDEQLSVSDLPITFFSTKEKREAVEFKARAFISESRKTTFNYEVKRVRAMWDPSLSIPGTGRRGGWRCPVGTRYGGQITDRFGRNCGWGVARRIANAITNIGERMESLDDRRRGRRVERRNRRMLERLGRAEGAGRVERGLRGIAEALDGGEASPSPSPRDSVSTPPRPKGPARRVRRGGFDSDARDAGLRDSERRRVRRELDEPGAPRTDTGLEEIVEPKPKPKPKRPARARRRKASEDRAKETATKRPAGEPMKPSIKPQPKPKRKKPVKKQPTPPKSPTTVTPSPVTLGEPSEGFDTFVNNVNNLVPLTDEDKRRMKGLWEQEEFSSDAQEVFENMVRDGNYGDVEDLKERIAINDQEMSKALARINEDLAKLRDRKLTGQQRIDALDRIVVNKRELQRRFVENSIFDANAKNPPWRRREKKPKVSQPPKPPSATSPSSNNPKTASIGAPQKKEGNKVAALGPDGLPTGKAKEIDSKIRTAEDAAKHLKDGGDLKDVPDIFVIEALNANSGNGADKRYKIGSIGGGINGFMRVFEEKQTGKRYLIKYEDNRAFGEQEDAAEILGNNIAGRMGFPVGGFRFVGPSYNDGAGQGKAVLFEHAENYVEGKLEKPTHSDQKNLRIDDAVAITLLDFAILNVDRHGGNFFVVKTPNGEIRMVPIDMSLSFGQVEFGRDKDYASAEGMRKWLGNVVGGGRNQILRGIRERVNNGQIDRAKVKEQVLAIQRRLRANEEKMQFALFGKDVMQAAGENGNPRKLKQGKPDHMVDFTNKRLKWLAEADADEIVNLILA